MGNSGLVPAAPTPLTPVLTPQQAAEEKEQVAMAARRDLEKKKEEYWRARSRALLTQIRVEEEQIAVVQNQIEQSRNTMQTPPTTVQVLNQPNYPYNYPQQGGIRIGGVPIGIGVGGYPTGGGYPYPNPNSGGNVVVINNQDQINQRGITLQERLTALQVQHQSTLVQYDEMCEEARRDGALPGWLR
jgi:hypothetical protein